MCCGVSELRLQFFNCFPSLSFVPPIVLCGALVLLWGFRTLLFKTAHLSYWRSLLWGGAFWFQIILDLASSPKRRAWRIGLHSPGSVLLQELPKPSDPEQLWSTAMATVYTVPRDGSASLLCRWGSSMLHSHYLCLPRSVVGFHEGVWFSFCRLQSVSTLNISRREFISRDRDHLHFVHIASEAFVFHQNWNPPIILSTTGMPRVTCSNSILFWVKCY